MATAGQVIKAALQKILVQASEAPLEADEYADAILSMNTYMLDLDAQGVSLGYTEVTAIDDEVTIPTGALRGLIYNLAEEVAPEYDGLVTQTLSLIAQRGEETMRILGQTIGGTLYPSTLPIGSGNYEHGFNSPKFYPEAEDTILAETTGSISLETDTNQVADST